MRATNAILLLASCADPLEIATVALPDAAVGVPYSFALSAIGGGEGRTWSVVEGVVAPGLALDPAGTLAGTPSEAGAFAFTLRVEDGSGGSDQRAYTLAVVGSPAPLAITTTDLVGAVAGAPYDRAITASGGEGAYAWSVRSGALPPGLTLADEGTPSTKLAGTPSAEGTFTFEVAVADAAGMTASRMFTLVVEPNVPPMFEIRTFLLPDGVEGTPYDAVVQVVNPSGAVAWVVDGGQLPPGLVLDASGDPHTSVAGTPSAAGDYSFVLRATDDTGATDTQMFDVSIAPPFVPISIATTSVARGTAGEAYAATITARDGTGSGYQWSVTAGQLAPGLAIGAVGTPDTLISGTPGMRGTYTATITVRDSNGDMSARSFVFEIVDPLLTIDSAIPAGDEGVAYATIVGASGGSGVSYAWSVSAGALPDGLMLQPSASNVVTIDGTPSSAGVFDFTLLVTEAGGQSATRDYSVPIYAPIQITTAQLAAGLFGVPYADSIQATGGSGNFAYAIVAGALPPGLALTSSTGAVTGTPSQPGTYGFTARATDDRGRAATRLLAIDVTAPLPAIVTTSLPGAAQGQSYAGVVTATGGSGAGYTWSVIAGSLPPGLSLPGSGTPSVTIGGMPTALGAYTFTVRVTDSFGGADTQSLTIDVYPPLVIPFFNLTPRIECTARRDMISASGGSGSGYAWSVVGSLPAGLSVEAAGTPATFLYGRATAPGVYAATIRVTDDAGLTAQRGFVIEVQADADAQRFAALVGDLSVNDDIEVFVVNICGDQPGAPVRASPTLAGADASLDRDDVAFSPENRAIAFIGDFATDGVDELFIATVASSGAVSPPVRASGPQAPNGDVLDLWWSADSRLIAYLADQNTDGIDELFLVDALNPALPAAPIVISAPLAAAANDVLDVYFAPDSSSLVYRADPTDGVEELFFVDVSNPAAPGAPVRLHAPIAAPRICGGAGTVLAWSPFGDELVFRCDLATAGVFELWYVSIDGTGPAAPQRVNDTLTGGGDVAATDFGFSPDASGMLYLADQNVDGIQELYVAAVFGGAVIPGFRVLAPLTAGENVTGFEMASDSVRAILRADITTDEVYELFLIDVGGGFPAATVRVSGAMVAGGDVDDADYGWSADGALVAYIADQTTNDRPELFVADMSGPVPGTPARVSPALGGANRAVTSFVFAPSSDRIACAGDFLVDGRVEVAATDLSVVPFGTPRIVNATPPAAGDVVEGPNIAFRRDSDGLLFLADMTTDEVFEGFAVDLSPPIPSAPVRIHGALPANGDLASIALEPQP